MDFKTLTDYIFDRITPYNLARHYAFAEMLYDKKADANIPAAYCEDGDFKYVVDNYDWSEGICYIRASGQQRSREDESGNVVACQDMLLTTIPLRLVLICKRSRYSPYDLAQVISSAVAGSYPTVQEEIGAVYVHAVASSVDTDIRQVLEDEFGDIERVNWDTSYLAIAAEIEIEVKGKAGCFDPCDEIVGERTIAPVITPNAGVYAGFVELTMTSLTTGARIYYTTDGTIPTAQNGFLYDPNNKPLLTSTATVRARAYADGLSQSLITSAIYNIEPITLTATPESGIYLLGTLDPVVFDSNSETASIYYTVDGSEPTTSSTEFTGAIPAFEVITTLKGRAFNPPALPSEIVTRQYDVKALPPVVGIDSGVFISDVTPPVSNPNPLGDIQQSVDGGAWEAYTGETFDTSVDVDYRIFADGVYVTSDVVSRSFEIKVATPTSNPVAGSVEAGDPIELLCSTSGATIHYTTNGSTPTISDPVFDPENPITFSETTTIKAIGVKAGCTNSDVFEGVFVVPFKMWLASIRSQLNGAIYMSIDEGANWSLVPQIGVPNNWAGVGGFDSGVALFAQNYTELWRSIDKGASWVRQFSPNDNTYPDQSIPANQPNLPLQIQKGLSATKMLMIGSKINPAQSNLFLSNDYGENFSPINVPPFGNVDWAAIDENGWIFASLINISVSGVYRTKDSGATWHQVQSPIADRTSSKIFIDGSRIYIGLMTSLSEGRQVLYSLNGGDTWQQTANSVRLNVFSFGAMDRVIALSTNDTLKLPDTHYSDDNFANITVVDPNPSAGSYLRNIMADKKGNILVTFSTTRLFLSVDNGASYTETQPAGNNNRNWYGLAMIGE